MANTRQTLSMDCSARETSCTPTWENRNNANMEKVFLQAGKNEDSLELELGASASRVHQHLHLADTPAAQRKSSGIAYFQPWYCILLLTLVLHTVKYLYAY